MSSTIFVSFSAIPKRARHVSSNFRSSVGAGILLVTVRKFTWVGGPQRHSRLEISGQDSNSLFFMGKASGDGET
jgi:hypothetical protein